MKIVDDSLRTETPLVSKFSALVEPLKEGKTLSVDATDGVVTQNDISNLRMLVRSRGLSLRTRHFVDGNYYVIWCEPIKREATKPA